MLKRLACLLLTGLIVLTLLPTAVFAEDEEQPIIPNEEQTETAGGTQAPVTGEPEQQDALSSDAGLNAAEEQPVITDEGQTEPIALFSAARSADEPKPGNVDTMPTGLGLSVTADNDTPAVGDTVQYTLEPTGVTPSGNARPLDAYGFRYKYRYGVMQLVDGEWQFVIDPSYQVFQENNVFSFTFSSNNTYQLSFYVIEMYPTDDTETQFYSKSESYTLNVTPTGTGRTVEEAADEVVEQCRAALPNGSQYDYALWLHDWILANCVYDYKGTGVLCGPEGVFFYGTGTCAAYRSAYKMLLDRMGIPNERCIGNGHEWNAVQLDGKWYQIDVTWDDVDYSEAFS